MEIPIKDQLLLLLLSALTGLFAAGLYELICLLKRDGRKKRNALLNAFFFVAVTAAAFTLSMLNVKGHSFIMEGGTITASFWLCIDLMWPRIGKILKSKGKNSKNYGVN